MVVFRDVLPTAAAGGAALEVRPQHRIGAPPCPRTPLAVGRPAARPPRPARRVPAPTARPARAAAAAASPPARSRPVRPSRPPTASSPPGSRRPPPRTPKSAPTETSFGKLGLSQELVTALERRDIRTAFPIQAATLADCLSGRDVLGRAQTGSGKTLALRPADADPPGRPEVGLEDPARPGARADPRARGAGARRARAARSRHRRQDRRHLRRRTARPPDRHPRARRRPRRRHPGPAARPDRATVLRPVEDRGHRARRGRPHGRHGLPARRQPDPRHDAGRLAATAVLGHPRRRRRQAGPPVPHRPGRPRRRPGRVARHHDGAPRAGGPQRAEDRRARRDR